MSGPPKRGLRASRVLAAGSAKCAGVSESSAAWRTARSRPNAESLSSSRSATSSSVGSRAVESAVDAAEIPEPAPGLRERHAHVLAAAFARLARARRHRGERHQLTRAVVERLRGQLLRAVDARGAALLVVEAGRRLHQRVEAAPPRPRSRRASTPRARRTRFRVGCARRPRARSRARASAPGR